MYKTHRQRGFTIVELLIVVVVIAILAAITIVSYNGITARAREVQQVAALDKIGKAIQLYVADKGNSMGSSGAGHLGLGYGGFTYTTASHSNYTAVSIEQLLREGGYLSGSVAPIVASQVLLSPCTNENDTRWVVLATVSPAPAKSAAQQASDTGCTNAFISLYIGGSYNKNLVKVY